jgi:AmmeMemoRadiSam system protein B
LGQPFCLTLKDFSTPLGTALTDKGIAAQLQKESPFDLLAGEWAHRSEHSIEFQVVFLQYLFPQGTFKILPVLCGNLFDEANARRQSQVAKGVIDFLKLLSDQMARSGKSICCVAGADLAHMGPRFGDREPVSPGLLAWIRSADLQLLKYAESMDNAGFLGNILQDDDKRRICGTAPIYALMSVCGARQGKLLSYNQAADPDGTQVVSFASMAFY